MAPGGPKPMSPWMLPRLESHCIGSKKFVWLVMAAIFTGAACEVPTPTWSW